ncbi:hypothetical protein IEQ34_026932 [Dendrobium chrysotoxum]|uniref:Uncharacterized protein n=1 Tax=Dendrobium chrysotoxum TaxID=161865 RepID=A0AAV7FIG3_DENCH|nr:hypothetical protein IEQ34_026932 [Dendrobium chrysotoxum]
MDPRSRVLSWMLYLVLPLMLIFWRSKRLHLGGYQLCGSPERRSCHFRHHSIGFFPSRRPSLDSIRRFFFNLKLTADFSITLLDSSHVLIKLLNDMDYSRVFCHISYLVFIIVP